MNFIDGICENIGKNEHFIADYELLLRQSVESHAGLGGDQVVSEEVLTRLVQSAAIFSQSSEAAWKQLAYRIGFASLVFKDSLGGLAAASRLILARLGNYPAIRFAFGGDPEPSSMPERIFFEIANRRDENTIRIGDRTAVLTDMQKSVWDALGAGQSIALSAPTSAGKSFVFIGFIEQLKRDNPKANIVYLVPSRALLTQVEADLRRASPDRAFDVTTVPLPPGSADVLPPLYVLTPERLQVLLQMSTEIAFDVAIVDEAHLIGEGSRGVILHGVLQEVQARRPTAQFLFSSPQVRNPVIFGSVVGHSQIQTLKVTDSPVAQNLIFVSGSATDPTAIKASLWQNGSSLALNEFEAAIPIYTPQDRLIYVSWVLGQGAQSLVYADAPASCEDIAMKIKALSADENVASVSSGREPSPEVVSARMALSEFAKEAVHPNYVLAETVLTGVGFHYGRIPPLLRNAVESSFAEGTLDYIVCTSTLLQGVNLPARNIFMHNPHKGDEKPIEAVDFWNLAGRAGRLGKDFQGNVFLVDYNEWESAPLAGPKDEVIRPSLERTLVDTPTELVDYINDPARPSGENQQFEAAFSKLLRDHRNGTLTETLERMPNLPTSTYGVVEEAIKVADALISLDTETLATSPQISGFRQQQLYDYMIAKIKEKGPEYLIPAHPSASWNDALNKLRPVFARVHKYLELKSGNHHRYWAPLALRWMRGDPLPVIIEAAISYHKGLGKNRSDRTVIREVLTDIESGLRFRYVNLLSCYCSVLKAALTAAGHTSYVARIPALTLYLELGAASQTIIQFVGMGLSRHTANKLASLTINRDMDYASARNFLARVNPVTAGLTPYVASELRRVLQAA